MGSSGTNWLLALGLDFDPVTDDLKQLKAAIAAKKKYWSAKSTEQMNGAFFRLMLDSVSEIESTILGDENRHALAKEAQDAIYPQLDKFIAIAGAAAGEDNDVEMDRLEQVAQKITRYVRKNEHVPDWEYPVDKVVDRAKKKGFIIIEDTGASAEEAKKAYEPYADRKRWTSFKGLDAALKNFGAKDLYSFALPDEGPRARHAPSDRLLKAIEAVRDEKAIHHNQEKSDTETILNMARGILASKESREEYDTYLEFLAVNQALEEMKELADLHNNEVTDKIYDATVSNVTQCISDKKQAALIVAGYCEKKNLRLQKTSTSVFCRFGHVNEAGSSRCRTCNLELKITCPSCSKPVSTADNYCSCGAAIGIAIDEAAGNCQAALSYLAYCDIENARDCLNTAKKAWPSFPPCSEIEKRITDLEKDIGPQAKKLKALMDRGAYYEARDVIAAIRRKKPKFSLKSEEKSIEAQIDIAEKALARAKTSSDEKTQIQAFSEALNACVDCKEAFAYMQSKRPEPASSLTAVVNAKLGEVALTWKLSPAAGSIQYSVVRKEGSAPVDLNDGDLVATTKGASAKDGAVLSGRQYYYSVFAVRFQTSSAAASTTKPILILKEVEGLRVAPSDSSVEFQWSPLDGAAEVEIWLESPTREKVVSTSKNYFLHPGLRNGDSYSYRIRVAYRLGNESRETEGIVVEATPIDQGEAINDFRVTRASGDTTKFLFSWTERAGSVVEFFSSADRGSIPDAGSLIPVSELENSFDSVALNDKKAGSATFVYGGSDPVYVFPVVRYGKTGVTCNCCRCFSQEEIKILDVYIANNEVAVRIEPPANAVGFVLLSRSDRFVTGIEENSRDGNQYRKQYSLKSFRQNGMLTFPGAATRDFYISVFAIYGSFTSPTYSEPTEFLFSNRPKEKITYSIKARNIPFVGPRATIEFRTNSSSFVLPDTAIVYGVNALPIFAGDGFQVATIPSQKVEGVFSIEIEGLPKRKNIYLKAIPTDGVSESYVLDPRSNSKIS